MKIKNLILSILAWLCAGVCLISIACIDSEGIAGTIFTISMIASGTFLALFLLANGGVEDVD